MQTVLILINIVSIDMIANMSFGPIIKYQYVFVSERKLCRNYAPLELWNFKLLKQYRLRLSPPPPPPPERFRLDFPLVYSYWGQRPFCRNYPLNNLYFKRMTKGFVGIIYRICLPPGFLRIYPGFVGMFVALDFYLGRQVLPATIYIEGVHYKLRFFLYCNPSPAYRRSNHLIWDLSVQSPLLAVHFLYNQ